MKKYILGLILLTSMNGGALAQSMDQYSSPFDRNNNQDNSSRYSPSIPTYPDYSSQQPTNNRYDTNDFSGLGMNRGQSARAADRANSINERPLSSEDFSGMGLSPAEGRRAADRANER